MNRTATKRRAAMVACLAGFLAIAQAGADELQDACALMRQQLDLTPGQPSISQVQGPFDDPFKVKGKGRYYGCIISLSGDTSKTPARMITVDQQFETGEKGVPALRDWKTDNDAQADGPDGTIYKIVKGPVFCFIDGHWDGGDDSDDYYQPSTEYKYVVSCGVSPQ